MKFDKHKQIIICIVCIVAVIATSWFVCRYYRNVGRNASRNAAESVQQIENNNNAARSANREAQQLSQSAQAELDSGQADIDSAHESVRRLSNSLDECTELANEAIEQLGNSQRLVDEERDIFADIDRANNINAENNQ